MVDERRILIRLDDALAHVMGDLLADSVLRRKMSSAMLKMARPDAARQVATMIYELTHQAIRRKAA
jgi:hypothetical protein